MADSIKELNKLITLDLDAIEAYQAAIKEIHHAPIRAKLVEFQDDHRRHVKDLSECVKRLGGQPEVKRDIKGFVLKGFTTISAKMGVEGALRAMQGNEKLTNHTYEKALEEQWSPDVREIVARNFSDERRHLAYIEQTLRNRTWEEAAAHP